MGYPKGVADILPLTSTQRGMLYHVAGEAARPGQYVAVITCVLNGALDPQRLRGAMQALVDTHGALRAGFVWEGVKQPVQVIRKTAELPWTFLDWSDASDFEDRLQGLARAEQARRFDLKTAPLMAATLVKASDTRWHLVWTVHHLISDGWSTEVSFRQIFSRYQTPSLSVVPEAEFKSYLVWLKKQKNLTDKAYWTEQLGSLSGPSLLPDTDQPARQESALSQHLFLGAELLARVQKLAADLKVTPNTILSAAWAILVRRILQMDDVVFGTTTAGRPPEIPGIADAIGAFVNTIPVRVQIDPSQSVAPLLQDMASAETTRRKHEHAALAEVQTCAPFPGGTSLFDTMFVNEGVAKTALDFGDIQLTELQTSQFSNYPLCLLVTPNSQFKAEIQFDPGRTTAEIAGTYLADYRNVLDTVTTDPLVSVQRIFRAQDPGPSITSLDQDENVVSRFLAQAAVSPDMAAVSDDQKTLTYAQLSERARQVAGALQNAGVSASDIVPVAVPRGADAVAAFLGVMMSGAAYVPLDLDYPEQRLRQVFEAVNPKFLVTTSEIWPKYSGLAVHEILVDKPSGSITVDDVRQGELAYVMFTSGSQNRPKGVQITHKGLAISTAARDVVHGAPPGAYLLLSSLAFDSSVAGIYWTLATGGHLVIAPRHAEQNPSGLGQLIAQHQITHTLCLPALADALLTVIPARDLQSLRMIIAAGEALGTGLIAKHSESLPQCRLVNEYGPTEGTVWCTSFDATEFVGPDIVPIGTAIPGTWVGIVDQDGCAVAPGTIGEIVVAGDTVAKGYLGDPTQTKERFFEFGPSGPRAYRTGDLGVSDPSGCVTFLGRKDKQVKIRGHRIELSELEAAANDVAGAVRVAALVLDNERGRSIALALESPANPDLCARVTRHIQKSLPAPFHPSVVDTIEDFPLLPNGKVDERALVGLITQGSEVPEGDAPQGKLENRIADLFSDILKAPCTTRDANFFDIGGDSLMTLAVYAKAKERGIVFEPTDIFSHPTVAELARRVKSLRDAPFGQSDDRTIQIANIDGPETAVVLVHCPMQFYRTVVHGLGPDHMVALLPSPRLPGKTIPFGKTLQQLGAEALASMGAAINGKRLILCGFSAGCALTLEIARQLGTERIDGLVVLDPPYKMVGAEPSLQPFFYRTYKRWRYQFRAFKHGLKAKRALPRMQADLAKPGATNDQRIDAVSLVFDLAINAFRVPRIDVPSRVFLTAGNPSLTPGDVLDTHLRDKTIQHLDLPHREVVRDKAAQARIVETIRALLD